MRPSAPAPSGRAAWPPSSGAKTRPLLPEGEGEEDGWLLTTTRAHATQRASALRTGSVAPLIRREDAPPSPGGRRGGRWLAPDDHARSRDPARQRPPDGQRGPPHPARRRATFSRREKGRKMAGS